MKPKKVITLGEVMMRLSTQGHERFLQTNNYRVYYGGAEANVAIALSQWDVQTAHITAFPDNDLGLAACRYLKQTGVDTSFVFKTPGRMGLYFLEKGVMQRGSKVIYDRFDSSFSQFDGAEIDWDLLFKDADWFHWTGITPALSQKAADLCLKALQEANARGIRVSADINYRRNLWQYGKGPKDVMPELISYSNVVVAGLEDFKNSLDIKANEYVAACVQVQQQFPNVEILTTTERESIRATHNRLKAILWDGRNLLHSKSYDMTPIVDRVGSGDAFMAGFIYGLLHMSKEDSLSFAVASAVLKHGIPGDSNLVSLEEIQQLVDGEDFGKLLR